MDMLSIVQTIWRHKLATLPVVMLTIVGAAYVIAIKPPVYQASASYLLMNPPAPPTADQIARDPSLGRINTTNPYVSYGDLSVVAQLLTAEVSTVSAQSALVKEGADSTYTVAPSQQFGLTTPLIQITATGATPGAAIRTATLVSQAVTSEMGKLQAAQRVDQRYWITTLMVDAPATAQLLVSGKLRALVGVLAIGLILMFVVVSTMKAIEESRSLAKASEARVSHPGASQPTQVRGQSASWPPDLPHLATPQPAPSDASGVVWPSADWPPDQQPAPSDANGVVRPSADWPPDLPHLATPQPAPSDANGVVAMGERQRGADGFIRTGAPEAVSRSDDNGAAAPGAPAEQVPHARPRRLLWRRLV